MTISDQHFWPRAIILVDMNAFFASVEQLDHPELRGRPIAVTNGSQGTCIITSSYEARAYGIKTGMRLREAYQRCPELIQCASNPHRYAAVSTTIMAALNSITPDMEIFSVDEAFLDVTHCQRLMGPPEEIAKRAKQRVFEASGLLCSVGLSGDKTTAKYAAKLQKPDGFTVIPPWQAEQRLSGIPVTELCGIGKGIGAFLAQYGVILCGDMKQLPISVLARRFGNLGRRIWYMAQGLDPEHVKIGIKAPQSVGHGKVMPPNTRDREILRIYLMHMSEKVARRLRRYALQANHFFIGLRTKEAWISGKWHCPQPTDDGRQIMLLCDQLLIKLWRGEGIHQVQVTALNPKASQQIELFAQENIKLEQLNAAMDRINNRYGEFSLAPARLIKRSKMPNVIAPAWQPSGLRQTIL
ncbi:MAG: DNA polymerase IV [Candidatus Polarisedimenticolaceae bacterium]|nr:DNA polymerase IV [Candidatus Polarisedimenticolaceae bacterium]